VKKKKKPKKIIKNDIYKENNNLKGKMNFSSQNSQYLFPINNIIILPQFFDKVKSSLIYQRKNIINPNFQRENNFSKFLIESKWNLQIKNIHNSNEQDYKHINGKIDLKDNISKFNTLNILFSNFEEVLPIDIRENQILTFDSSQQKVFLKFNFPINLNNGFNIRNVNKELSNQIFDIKLSGLFKQKKILTEPINFQVKGFDIVKSIIKTLNNKETIPQIKEKNVRIISSVFNNIQMSFLVEFQISLENLKKVYTFTIKKINTINDYSIKITKIILVYCLQYSSLIRKIKVNNISNNFNKIDKVIFNLNLKNNFNKKSNQNKIKHNKNFCNWHSFMTSTTPIYYESDELLVMNIFNLIQKPSLFGIDIILKDEELINHKIKYFPVLSCIFIETSKLNFNNSLSTKSSSNSFNLNDKYYEIKTKNMFFFKENHFNIYEIPSYSEQIKNFLENNPEAYNITLNDVSENSYFSLIWIPFNFFYSKTILPSGSKLEKKQLPIFQVFYKFKSFNQCTYKVKFMPVIGILEKNYKGYTEYSMFNDVKSETFWFKNLFSNNNNYLVDLNNNLQLCKELISFVKKNQL
jgi:hypothetical protein